MEKKDLDWELGSWEGWSRSISHPGSLAAAPVLVVKVKRARAKAEL